LISLDDLPLSAELPIVLGLFILPPSRVFASNHANVWTYLALLLGSLDALLLVSAVCRILRPLSAEAKQAREDATAERRSMRCLPVAEAVLSQSRLGGGAGLLFWQKTRTASIALGILAPMP
jgi:hypothetical protein